MERYQAVKKRVFEVISKAEDGDKLSVAFDWVIVALIALSIVSIILESFAGLYDRYQLVFKAFELFTIVVFSVEYLLRIWTADLLHPEAKHPYLKYIFSFMALVDLSAVLPFYLPFVSADLRFLRMMRLFRLFRLLRVFKLGRYFDALQTIMKVIRASGPQLVVSVAICFFVVLFSAIIMYTVENPVQPEQFPNIVSSRWWAICTLTTVGYGDVYPITSVGRFLASLISLVGIGIIAIPTGIIAAGFNKAITQSREEKLEKEHLSANSVDELNEEEMLLLQMKLSHKLRSFGYTVTVSNREEDADE